MIKQKTIGFDMKTNISGGKLMCLNRKVFVEWWNRRGNSEEILKILTKELIKSLRTVSPILVVKKDTFQL